MKKRLLSIILSIMMVIAALTLPISATAEESLEYGVSVTYQEWSENLSESNTIINSFFEYYGESNETEVEFPDYYSGFEIQNDGTLVLHVTEADEKTLCLIYEICGTHNFDIEEEKYSFNELFSVLDKLDEDDMEHIGVECAVISIPNNTVNLYVGNSAYETAQMSNVAGSLDSCVTILQYTSVSDAVITASFPSGYVSPETFDGYESNAITGEDDMTRATSTTLKYGALGYSNGQYGTVGYLALDSDGNKILVTHGHELSNGGSYKYGGSSGTIVGTVTVLGNSDTLDASIVTLKDSTTTITNKANWSSETFTSVISSNSSLLSISGNQAYYYGTGTGKEQGSVLTGIKSSDGTYSFYFSDIQSENGDSGAPVYTKSGSALKLLGIIKGWNSGGTIVITVPTIKSAYSHYVYLNSESYT